MKQQLIKKTFTSLVLLLSISYAGVSSAHTYSGFMPNKTTQVLTLNCPAGTVQVNAEVADGASNNGIMSVTIVKGANAITTSDLQQGGNTYGPDVTLVAGAGTYFLIASHTAPVAGPYLIQYHCEASNGAETTVPAATLTQP
jgi:ribosomal protein L11